MAERFGAWLLRNGLLVVLAIAGLTGFFAWQIRHVKVDSPTIDLFPSDHPYVETFVKYTDVFGGASTVLIAVEVKEGDIFNLPTLQKVYDITKEVELLPAVNNYQVLSLAQRKVKELKVDPVRGFVSIPLMWPDLPKSEEEVERLREMVYSSTRYFGSLVSRDSKAALIVAGFFEKQLDSATIKQMWAKLDEVVKQNSDARTEVFVIGRPVMLGQILEQYPQIYLIMGLTVLAMIGVLMLYFRDLHGIVIPLVTALISTVWGLGFLGLLRYNFDPLVIVIPFIISARALSHSVQEVERYYEEFIACGDRRLAAVRTFAGLLHPATVGVVADAAAVFLVWFTPIPLLQKLALMGSFWVMSIMVSNVLLNPILLAWFPVPKRTVVERKGILDRILAKVPYLCVGRGRNWVVVVSLVVLAVGFVFASRVVIGDAYPGTPMLWPDSRYNQDTDRIAKRFGNTEMFTVVVEGKNRESIKDPAVLSTMAAFQRHMERLPEVSSTSSIADYLPGIISILHGSDPKWELIPEDKDETGQYMEMIYSNSEPGDLARFVTIGSQNANITLYLQDHKGETLRAVVAAAKDFIAAHPMEQATFRLAGGYGGLLAAINEVVLAKEAQITFLAFAIIVLFCGLADRSLLAGFLYLLPLVVSNYLTYALMGARGIGLDVNALPVVALGVGLGVDYGLYIMHRTQEEYKTTKDIELAIARAVTTAGRAVAFTASTMVVGVVFWTMSFLKFQADMGLLLVFWMVVSMLGGLILQPALVAIIKPKFITRG